MSREFIGYYQSDIRTSRKENSDYAMAYTSQQALIDKLQQENQKLRNIIDKIKNALEKEKCFVHSKSKVDVTGKIETEITQTLFISKKTILDILSEAE